jgi:hypothetical protein
MSTNQQPPRSSGPPAVRQAPARSNGAEMVPVPSRGMAARTFGGELEASGQTASAALAAQARAQVEARYIMAKRFPRDVEVVRQALLKECKRPLFAANAIYRKPVGKEGIEGPSIRFAEAATRCMTNIDTAVTTVYEDDASRIVEVSATDLESNVRFPATIVVQKTVERSKVRDGQTVLSRRINSRGYEVFVVQATDDEVMTKANALISKNLRTCLLRLIPGDLIDEAMSVCYETQRNKAAQDPDAAVRLMLEAFATIGASAEDVARYLGHPLIETTPDEITDMRAVWNAINNQETTWQAALEFRLAEMAGETGGDDQPPREKTPAPQTTAAASPPSSNKPAASLQDAAASARAKREAATAPPRETTPPPERRIRTDMPPPPPDEPPPGWGREPGEDG